MPHPHVGTLSELVAREQIGRVTNSLTETIGASFAADGSTMTGREVKRRFDICLRIFCELRADLKWSIPHILDRMPRYLRCELDGGKYNPQAERAGAWGEEADPLAAAHLAALAPPAQDALLVGAGGEPLVSR